jgi:hypothetical protein
MKVLEQINQALYFSSFFKTDKTALYRKGGAGGATI